MRIVDIGIFIFFAVGIISGLILYVDKFFLKRRYPFLAGSCMYNLLLQDSADKLELTTITKKKASELLVAKYNIHNSEDAFNFMENFFENRNTKDYSNILYCINNDEYYDSKSEDILKRFNIVKRSAISEYGFDPLDFKNISNLSAYKYSNIGYALKLCYKANLLNEKDTMNYLRDVHMFIEDEYDDWLDYGISFIAGKVVNSKKFEDDLLYILDFLIFDSRSLWNKTRIYLDQDRSFKDYEY